MQPYFIPYAGYFRLFHAADLFVIYDCVQFPRRGWVHRNQLYKDNMILDWLTLPLQKQEMNVRIKDLAFRHQANSEWQINLNRFHALNLLKEKHPRLFTILCDLKQNPLDYITNCLREICNLLNISFNIVLSSSLHTPQHLKGQDRILAIAEHFHAAEYVNSPGGRSLYSESEFLKKGIRLFFLPEFKGEYYSIVQSLITHDIDEVREKLVSQCLLE